MSQPAQSWHMSSHLKFSKAQPVGPACVPLVTGETWEAPGDGVLAKVMPGANCKVGHQLQIFLMPKLSFCRAALQQVSEVMFWSHPPGGLITVEGHPNTMGAPELYQAACGCGVGLGVHRGQSKGHRDLSGPIQKNR